MAGITVTCPSLHALDVYGADRYETAPTWGPGLCSGPYRGGGFYLTGPSTGQVLAMGCAIGWTDLAGHDRTWSSVTMAPWAAGPLSVTGLGQATPWHISVSRATVGFYSRQRLGDQLVQHTSLPIASPAGEGETVPVAIAAAGRRVAVVVGGQVLVDEQDAYSTAERGQWPCWETYVGDAGQDPRPWIGEPWAVCSPVGGQGTAGVRRLLGQVPDTAASALALALDALE